MINEIDIQDMRALYELDRGSYFRLADKDPAVPPASDVFNESDVFKFMGVDGMYSKCYDSNGTLIHFAAWTQVIPWVK